MMAEGVSLLRLFRRCFYRKKIITVETISVSEFTVSEIMARLLDVRPAVIFMANKKHCKRLKQWLLCRLPAFVLQ